MAVCLWPTCLLRMSRTPAEPNGSKASARAPLAGLAALGLGTALVPLDFAVNVAFPAITEAFALNTRAIRWVAVCYVLTYGSLMLGFGALGDRIGHVRVYRAGLLLAAVAFTLCTFAPSYDLLLLARVLQGVSVALTLSCAPALATLMVDPARRTWALSTYAAMSAVAAVTAPLLGGVCLAGFGWRGVYGMRIPIALIALVCVPLIAHRIDANRPRPQQPFDLTGSGMLAGAMALILLAPALISQSSDLLIALPVALAGFMLMAAFAQRERAMPEPFLPTAIARSRDFQVINLAGIVVQFTCFAVPLITPYFLLRILQWNPMSCGAMLALWSVGSLLGSTLAVRCIAAIGARQAAGLAGVAIVLGLAGVAAWPRDVMPAIMVGCLLVHGFGLGLFQVAYSDLVIGTLPVASRGVAGSLTMVTRTVGIVLGASIWLGLLQAFEASGVSDLARERDAFMRGFTLLFCSASAVAAAFFVITARRWRAVPQ